MTVRAMAVFASVGMLAGCTNGSNPDGSFGVNNDLIGSGPFGLHPVLAANPKVTGASSANFLPPELIETPVAQGSIPVENPATVTLADGSTTTVTHYGYDGDGPLLPAPGDLPSATHLVEASKTEPDKNTYLVLFGQHGHAEHPVRRRPQPHVIRHITFLSKNQVIAVEDRGDGLHAQANALDSGWAFDVTLDYSIASNQPVRLLAEGRDASATLDSAFSGMTGFQNEGDNEITGIHMSSGEPGPAGVLGANVPTAFKGEWRRFYTQQHGDNITWEILSNPRSPALLTQ